MDQGKLPPVMSLAVIVLSTLCTTGTWQPPAGPAGRARTCFDYCLCIVRVDRRRRPGVTVTVTRHRDGGHSADAKGAARSLTIASSWMMMAATPPSRRTRRHCARTCPEICGPVEAYQLVLQVPSASVIQPLTRSYFANKGKALGLQVKVARGDVIVVELTHENEKYMLGVVTKAHYKHSGEDIRVEPEVPY